jgi:HAD superfamily hydrolase (TIGR01509 family)
MIKAVLFDLDGVLLDSEPVNKLSGILAFRDIGIRLGADEKNLITGRHPADYDKIFRSYGLDAKKMVELHHKYYRKFYYRSKPFSFARRLVLNLKNRGYKLALVTASELKDVRRALRLLKLTNVFDVLITFELCRERKPSPLPYLLAARKLGLKPSECVVIEDSVAGVNSAKRAKMKCVAITNSFPAPKLKKAGLIVKTLNDRRIWKFLC